MKKTTEGEEITRATLVGIRDFARTIGKPGVGFTPQQLNDMSRAVRALLSLLDLKKRLSDAPRA